MFTDLFSLRGRIALVTGGSRGIGKMIAGGFLSQGAAKVYITARKAPACEATANELNAARHQGRRVVAAGTTTVRTLEHCALSGEEFVPHSGSTSIFIAPRFKFRAVNALLTNFHLPQSTLLMLVSAFGGRDHVLNAYRHAVSEKYRFFSYGDCMFIA